MRVCMCVLTVSNGRAILACSCDRCTFSTLSADCMSGTMCVVCCDEHDLPATCTNKHIAFVERQDAPPAVSVIWLQCGTLCCHLESGRMLISALDDLGRIVMIRYHSVRVLSTR